MAASKLKRLCEELVQAAASQTQTAANIRRKQAILEKEAADYGTLYDDWFTAQPEVSDIEMNAHIDLLSQKSRAVDAAEAFLYQDSG